MLENRVIIIGAGPAGCSTALFLAKYGIPCTLLDKNFFPRDKVCGDALSGKVVEVLKKLNPALHQEISEIADFLPSWGVNFVAPNQQCLRVPFANKSVKTLAPGFISKRFFFDNFLIEKVKKEPLINLIEGCEIREFERREKGWILVSKKGEEYRCEVVVAADGPNSLFAKKIGGLKIEPAHNCFGLRAYYSGVKNLDAENFIELHFIKDILPGYFWIFPLPNGEANVGIGMRSDKMQSAKINLKKSVEQIIEKHPVISKRFETAKLLQPVSQWSLPLGSKKRKLSGDGFILIGDAAQLVDPFTGEGIGNAMMSGYFAANTLVNAVAANSFTSKNLIEYDVNLYKRLSPELNLSYRMQQLVNFPFLFNFIVKKANNNAVLKETISCMFEDLELRSKLKQPSFYWKLLFNG